MPLIKEKADVAVESLIPGLEPPVAQRLPSQTESVTSNRTGQSGVFAASGNGHCDQNQSFHLWQMIFCSPLSSSWCGSSEFLQPQFLDVECTFPLSTFWSHVLFRVTLALSWLENFFIQDFQWR